MVRISNISMPLGYTDADLRRKIVSVLRVASEDVLSYSLAKRSVDARKKDNVHFLLAVDVTVKSEKAVLSRKRQGKETVLSLNEIPYIFPVAHSTPALPPVVVGTGPAGLFAALMLARAGAKPLVLERGGDVDSRQEAVKEFRLTGKLNTENNVQFGEGGAGTFSDGKLNSGIKDVRSRFVLETFVKAGAPASILWQAKPHIGTDELRRTVKGLREEIIRLGGEVLFHTLVTDAVIEDGNLRALTVVHNGQKRDIPCRQAIFATGHSARDTVQMLYSHGVRMEQKPFAVGVRVEHPRTLIDESQYGSFAGHPALGAADYKLHCVPDGQRGVFSFCMCPGGEIIAAASEEGGIAVNGMSNHARDGVNSNSALLVGVEPSDFGSDHPLAGFDFQREIEQKAFLLGGKNFYAPAETVTDFLENRPTGKGNGTLATYRPGVVYTDLRECLPSFVFSSLQKALPLFGRQIKGFDGEKGLLTGVESRSSSPVRLLRDDRGRASVGGIYPCGEGAGYAGGILSAAVDGIRSAEWLLQD